MEQIALFQAIRFALWDTVADLQWSIPAWVCIGLIVLAMFLFLAWSFFLSDFLVHRRLPKRLAKLGFHKRTDEALGDYEKDGLKVGFIAMDALGYTGWIHTLAMQADNTSRTALTQAQWLSRLSDVTGHHFKELAKPWQEGGCDLQIAVTDQYVLAQWRIPFRISDLLMASDQRRLDACLDVVRQVHQFLPRSSFKPTSPQPSPLYPK